MIFFFLIKGKSALYSYRSHNSITFRFHIDEESRISREYILWKIDDPSIVVVVREWAASPPHLFP